MWLPRAPSLVPTVCLGASGERRRLLAGMHKPEKARSLFLVLSSWNVKVDAPKDGAYGSWRWLEASAPESNPIQVKGRATVGVSSVLLLGVVGVVGTSVSGWRCLFLFEAAKAATPPTSVPCASVSPTRFICLLAEASAPKHADMTVL